MLVQIVDEDQTRTVRPVGGQQSTQLEEINIDFRVSGLPHAVVKQEGNFIVREFVKKIECRPHREALQPTCSGIPSTTHSVTNRQR